MQYPGVADAIDSDLNTLAQMLRLANLVPKTRAFNEWLEEIKTMLNQEVDYIHEAKTTQLFKTRLHDQADYVVPSVFSKYSTRHVMASSFEPGHPLTSKAVTELSQNRRNHIGLLCMNLCWQEVFHWGEMQTDPNFGNYLVRIGHDESSDKLILLDFGAVKKFDPELITLGRSLIRGAYNQDRDLIKQSLIQVGFLPADAPDSVIDDFSELCYLAIEPFTADEIYNWRESKLASRVVAKASRSALSRYFNIPPKEFMFLSRKLMGAYTLMDVLDVKMQGRESLEPFL